MKCFGITENFKFKKIKAMNNAIQNLIKYEFEWLFNNQ
jgi:hypothetical protein